MSIFNEFPYTNFHELNLDWILAHLKKLEDEWAGFVVDWSKELADQVDTWLTEHPEYTTTVVDGSLTADKFTDQLKLLTLKDYVTPEMYGAVGDGVTNDSDAVRAALASGKHVVLLGTYAVQRRLPLISNSSITGIVPGAGFKWNTYAPNTYHIGGSELTNIRIKNVKMDFGAQTQLLHSFSLFSCTDIVIEECEFTGGYGYATRFNDCDRLTVKNCYFHDITGAASNPGGGIYGASFKNFNFTGCVFENLTDHGIYCAGTQSAYAGVISDCIFRFNGLNNDLTNGAAICLYGNTHDVIVANCVIAQCKCGVHISDYANVETVPYNIIVNACNINGTDQNGIECFGKTGVKCYNVEISNNTIRNAGQDAISVSEANFVEVNNNAIYATERDAIKLSYTTDATISSNNIRLCKSTGILVGSPGVSTDVDVIGNRISTSSDAGYTGVNGIYTGSGAARIRLFNNTTRGFTVNVVTQGTDHIIMQSGNIAGKSIFWSDDITESIYHNVGDLVIIKTPVAGQPCMYICTVAGSPGTLKAIATVSN